jgi:hypothetical protein
MCRAPVSRQVFGVCVGLLGEPLLRFGVGGVWVNRRPPTAAADKPTGERGVGWVKLTGARVLASHDQRLTSPSGLAAATNEWDAGR